MLSASEKMFCAEPGRDDPPDRNGLRESAPLDSVDPLPTLLVTRAFAGPDSFEGVIISVGRSRTPTLVRRELLSADVAVKAGLE